MAAFTGDWLCLVYGAEEEDGERCLKLALNLQFCLVICVGGQGQVPHVPCNLQLLLTRLFLSTVCY